MKYFQKFDVNTYIFIISVLVVCFIIGLLFGRLIQRIKDSKILKKERQDAVKRSRAVIGGQFTEQLAPYLPKFPCNPGDVRFIGKPVDYIGFRGSAEGKGIEEILLIEVKTGSSQLNEHERQIKDAVEKGRVKYVEYRINTQ